VIKRALKDATPGNSLPPVEPGEQLPLVGRSVAMQSIYRTLARLMATDLTVLITGESGTGKELVARALHDYGKRRNGPFVAINMAAIPHDLLEAELFGHERGAFTGATDRGIGRFEQAQRGTLFLDEIGDMPIEAQTRLLRVLQDGEYTTVGGRATIKADVRIVAATHRDLGRQVTQGKFREDLYYRLNVVPVHLPPLRERVEDIPELVEYFFARGVDTGLPFKIIDPAGMKLLLGHRWLGNVRELKNFVQRLAVLYVDETINAEIISNELTDGTANVPIPTESGETLSEAIEHHLKRSFFSSQESLPLNELYNRVLREMERPLILMTLAATGGNQIKASEILGLNRNTLRKKIRELDIEIVRGAR
jgi:two-component system nitrogen regulation response regulator GlnG